ncbi:MAG: hypothetical protein LBP78_01650 [Acidaminococcales bacterium]|jgi:hypothetical protein|nr:hypothetical protein [Acidaminococcales bacterium]
MKSMRLLLILLAIVLGFPGAAAARPVEEITVNVFDVTGNAGAPVLARMAYSMKAAGEQIMAGKPVDYIEFNNYMYSTVLADVANRVFTGYNTEEILITPGEETIVDFYVRPWGPVTDEVKVAVHFSGADELWFDLFQEETDTLRLAAGRILKGISVDAVDWAGILAKKAIRETLEAQMPYFKATADVYLDGNAVVADIVLSPVGRNVQGVNYELRSYTMPTLVLNDARKRLGDYAGKLRGLPVEFVARYEKEIKKIIKARAEEERIARQYGLKAGVELSAGVDADVVIELDSEEYRFWIEGYIDIARADSSASGRAHIGRLISRKDEIFLEATFYTNEVRWKVDPGISRRWANTALSALYRLPDRKAGVRLEIEFLKNWLLRAERFVSARRPEFALRYRLHEFLAFEFIVGEKENYFRVVGNL